jgi:hypothetical protein
LFLLICSRYIAVFEKFVHFENERNEVMINSYP